ncbi:16S rRNA (uracil(1498)-N(3))-methyltransferase [Sphingomonas sp. IC-11]|uniref:16S rRNA (uracil(1498)-N(3))-methyltransferase n=1 Tax=Sphingomonas sp. IC-11 TaxID=2898528 RepID=UPI001E31F09E|nr:16S rRNA (uracil(1498)-N(3))-methyltransferase [Sphingomonas sp. IC-11]MCD2315031.1 16S rRNA (uracil(1498)-N(3))-methyltransferase [Sphingomonas sp. IC-11]
MIATPAWPPRSTPRLFVDQPLAAGPLRIEGPQAHYLASVMRVRAGDPVRLFDDITGEWLAVVAATSRRDVALDVTEQLAAREAVPDLWLVAAPLKKGRVDWMAEKACELGVARLVPVITHRTVVDRPKVERLRAHMIEAAEQCGRTALPMVTEPLKLPALLRGWPVERSLYFADELGGAPAREVMKPGPAAILIGPEGGFDEAEREAIRALPQAVGMGLGPRILRADTAAAAAVAIWMANAGDW